MTHEGGISFCERKCDGQFSHPNWIELRGELTPSQQIAVFGVLLHEIGGVGAARFYLKIFGARKVERGTRHSLGKSAAFKWLRNFRVVNDKFPGTPPIIEQTEFASDAQLETPFRGIMHYIRYFVLFRDYSFLSFGNVWENRRASSACSITTAGSR